MSINGPGKSDRWLIERDRPDAEFFVKLYSLARDLVPRNPDSNYPEHTRIERGDLRIILAKLKEKLENDYMDHLDDLREGQVDYKVSYVLDKEPFLNFSISILTCLSSKKNSGKILYGDVIFREDEDTFILLEITDN